MTKLLGIKELCEFWQTIKAMLNNKVDKVSGKGLSTNDYTTADKDKLAGIAAGAEVNVQSDWNVSDNTSDAFIKNKPTVPSATSQLTNDSNFVSDANYVHTDNNFTTAEKTKLTGIEDGAQVNIPMVILKYGISTWNDFIDAYQNNAIVYCRASSGSNPASGAQTMMAFMAYINAETNPTEVEFQYYRSVSSHSDSQQGDQVYVYKLNKNTGWSVTVRNSFTKIVAGTGLASSFSNGVLTIRLDS